MKWLRDNYEIEDDITDPRDVFENGQISKWKAIDEISDKIDLSTCNSNGLKINDQIQLAEKNHLLFIGQYEEVMSPKQFAEKYTTSYITNKYSIVEYADLRRELAKKEKALANKINILWTAANERFEDSESIEIKHEIKHINYDFNFTDWYARLQTIAQKYWGYDEDFWCGSDRENSYDDELHSLYKAIKAKEAGQSEVTLEYCTYADIKEYRFLVGELLSEERINMHYEDFEKFKKVNPESFNEYIVNNRMRQTVYKYLFENNTL